MSSGLVARLLPPALNQITEAMERCVQLAVESENVFINVMNLTGEISEAVGKTLAIVDHNVTLNKMFNTTMYIRRVYLTDIQQKTQQRHEELKTVAENARAAYEKAINDLPKHWNGLFLDVVRKIGGVFSGDDGVDAMMAANVNDPNANGTAIVTDMFILKLVSKMQSNLTSLQVAVNDDYANWTIDRFAEISTALTIVSDVVDKAMPTKIQSMASQVFGEAVKIARSLEKSAKSGKPMGNETKLKLSKQMDDIVMQVEKLTAAASTVSTVEVPASASATLDDSQQPKGHNERFTVRMRYKQLKYYEQNLENSFRKLTELNERLGRVEEDLATIRTEGIKLKDIQKLLYEVIDLLGSMRRHWDTLIQYFSMVALTTTVSSNTIIQPFISFTSVMTNINVDERKEMRNMVIDMAQSVDAASFCLYKIANTYVTVSSNYVLGDLAGIDQLLSATDDDKRNQMREDITKKATAGRQSIVQLIKDLHTHYRAQLHLRLDNLQQFATHNETDSDGETVSSGDDVRKLIGQSQSEEPQGDFEEEFEQPENNEHYQSKEGTDLNDDDSGEEESEDEAFLFVFGK